MARGAEPSLTDRVVGSPRLRRMQVTARVLSRALARLEIVGAERIPADGPVLVAVNHRDFLDGPVLFGLLRRPITCLVKAEAFGHAWGPLLVRAGQVPVVRDTIDPAPVRLCLDVLRAGGAVGIFPEGTRGVGRLDTARPGVGWLALRSGATVVPVAFAGTDRMIHDRGLARPRVRVLVGEPMPFDEVPRDRPLNRAVYAAAAERVRVALAALVAENDSAAT